jgi:electron transfer flavoprotein alpha subunit
MSRTGEKEILVVAEHSGGALNPVSLEAAAFGRELSRLTGAAVRGVILSSPALPLAREFGERAGMDALALEHPELPLYNAEAYLSALTAIMVQRQPSYVVIPHTATGWDYAPRLAVRAHGSCLTAVNGIVPGSPPSFLRGICNGKIVAEVAPMEDRPAVVTVMPGAFAAKVANEFAPAINVERVSAQVDFRGTKTLGRVEAKKRELDLTKARVIVAAGRGIGKPEALALVRELAGVFERSALGSSRPLVDAGWLPLERQVGQTGQTVAPRLYIACGISGAVQHAAGMKNSELIVAVNIDPGAMIFNIAHLGVVADLHQFIPVLIEKLRKK